MSFARARGVGVSGVEGFLVEVEAHLAAGLPGLTLVGLPDTALSEARDRIRAAVVTSGESWPARRITVGLSPASRPKRGSGFDLAIAAAVLAAAGAAPPDALERVALLGELGLDGRVRPIAGVLPAVLAVAAAGIPRVIVPAVNAAEAALVPDVAVTGVATLRGLLARLRGETVPDDEAAAEPPAPPVERPAPPDLADVAGQFDARWAVEVAAAGGHHLLLTGPPGAGKTMLAERLPGLLPDLDRAAALEVTAIHSVAGALAPGAPLVARPPFAAPHHTASVPALVGGGSGVPRPGAASLAHRGVLFLDEAPEFAGGCLDALRQPLESGEVVIARAAGLVRYPARFTLVLAANPCPCAAPAPACRCPSVSRRRYLARLSGPLLDRVDLTVPVRPVGKAELLADIRHAEPTEIVAGRVALARDRAAAALAGTPWRTAAELPGSALRRTFAPAGGGLGVLERALASGVLSARRLDRVLRVSWTLAFLGGVDRPGRRQLREALALHTGAPA